MFPETIEHIVAGCPVVAQSIYLDRHDAVASAVHWSLYAQYGFPRSEQWWQHQLQPVLDILHRLSCYINCCFIRKEFRAGSPDNHDVLYAR